MGIIETIKSWFISGQKPSDQSESAFDVENFIYIKIPGNIQPLERGELFEDKIDPILAQDNLGSVSGGGSTLSDPLPDGTRVVEWCGIDIDVTDRDSALVKLRELLPTLDAPHGTELQYTCGETKLQDVFVSGSWQLRLQRESLHPGFGV